MPFDALVEPLVEPTELALIDRAIERLKDPAHWCKGKARDGDSFCIIGAALHGATSSDATSHVLKALNGAVRPDFAAVWRFNDDPKTTHADVMALLRRVRAQFT